MRLGCGLADVRGEASHLGAGRDPAIAGQARNNIATASRQAAPGVVLPAMGKLE